MNLKCPRLTKDRHTSVHTEYAAKSTVSQGPEFFLARVTASQAASGSIMGGIVSGIAGGMVGGIVGGIAGRIVGGGTFVPVKQKIVY